MNRKKSFVRNFVNTELKEVFELMNNHIILRSLITDYKYKDEYLREHIYLSFDVNKDNFEENKIIIIGIVKDILKTLFKNKRIAIYTKRNNFNENINIKRSYNYLIDYFNKKLVCENLEDDLKSFYITIMLKKVNFGDLFILFNERGEISISLLIFSMKEKFQQVNKYNKDWENGHKLRKGYVLEQTIDMFDFDKSGHAINLKYHIFRKHNNRNTTNFLNFNKKIYEKRISKLTNANYGQFFSKRGFILTV